MKKILGIFSVLALIASIGIQGQATAQELAPKDRNRVPALLLTDPGTNKTDRWESNGSGAAKVVIVSGGGGGTVAQGVSGVDTDPWNMMMRDSSGVELGLAASPFGVSIFDAASNLLGVTANPFVVDLGINNDVLIQATAVSPGSVRLSDGTVFYKGAEDRTLSTAPFSVRQTDGTSFFKAAEDRTTAGAPASNQLSDGSVFYKAMDQATGDDIELNTDTAQTASEPVVIAIGDTATLIFTASATTRTVTMQHMGEATIFLGKSGVTTTTGVAIKGGTVDNDAKGDTAVATHGDDIYGIVVAGTENLRIQVVSD